MLLSPDKTGFPLLVIPDVELEVHLLPVSKLQIEQFIAETTGSGTAWYQELLTLNPAPTQNAVDLGNREQFFISGVRPAEACAFARWLGDGFDLPTAAEWRAIYHSFQNERFPSGSIFFDWATEPVNRLVKKLLEHHPRRNMREITLMRGGLVEWVRKNDAWIGLGAPRPSFYPNLWNPAHNHVKPIHSERRMRYFGFRLVRRGLWDIANKPGGVYIF